MSHDVYYGVMPNSEVLASELDKYIQHIEDCLKEDGIIRDMELEMQSSLYSAKAVRADIKRIYEE